MDGNVHEQTFCPNLFECRTLERHVEDTTMDDTVSPFSSVSVVADNNTAPSAPQVEGSSSQFRPEKRPPAKHDVRGEEPADEMRRKGLGEEPSWAFDPDLRFKGLRLGDIFVVERFAGTARLTKSLKRTGFQAMAFDRSTKRSEGQVILQADLSNREEVSSFLDFVKLKAQQIAYIHMAPPCGTASRARGKRLRFLKAHNIKEPMPLRDDKFPDGFQWLSGSDKVRTEVANILYENTVLIAQTAIEFSIAICIENPSNSLMWKTSPFQQLLHDHSSLKFIHFHNCAHGGTRDKRTAFLTNVDWFDSLQIFCNEQHKHASWTPTVVNGRANFPTHSEAAYPEILCERIASLLKQVMLRKGAVEIATLQQQVKAPGKTLNRVILGSLPRGKHVKPLVSAFGAYVYAIGPVQADHLLQKILLSLPKGASIQSRLITAWGEVRDAVNKQIKKKVLEEKLAQLKTQQTGQQQEADLYGDLDKRFGCQPKSSYKFLCNGDVWEKDTLCNSDGTERDVCEKVTIAIPREPMDFVQKACEAGHPRSLALSLPLDLQDVVTWNRDADALDIYRHRIGFVKYWTARAVQLKEKDAEFLSRAPPHLTKILCGKRLALWQDMIEHFQYPDKDLVKDVVNGFPVTGWMPDSQVFPRDFKAPNLSVEALQHLSRGLNERVRAKVIAAAESELTKATWEETWMEIDNGDGSNASWAARFGLDQRDKVRVIDDFSVAGINYTTGLQEKLKIFGIDDIAALLAFSIDTCESDRHPTMLGKTMDLKSAYKQFGIRCADRERIRVATCRPSSSDLVLLMVNALPFAATGSVSGFLRVSMFLWFIGVIGLKLAWTSFYDDYTMISRADCSSNAAWAAECLFGLMGILYAKEGKKATSFGKTFGALGVVFDLSNICNKSFLLMHTEKRREELMETLQSLLRAGTFTSKAVERLRGRLLWYENFVCGRQANMLVAQLGKFIGQGKGEMQLSCELRETLSLLLERVQAGKPIEVCTRIFTTWVCFTDGACEEKASIGAVLVNPNGQAAYTFGAELPLDLQQSFYLKSKHPIYEVELLPVFVSTLMWGDLLSRSQVVYYLDNDAAKTGFVKGSGATEMANVIINGFCHREALLQLKTWFSRVPTHSNVGDAPSRLDFSLLDALGCARCEVPWQDICQHIWSRLSRNGAMAGRV